MCKFIFLIGILFSCLPNNAQAQTVNNPIQIKTCQDLQNMNNNLAGSYVLANDIDCSATNPADPNNAASIWNNGYGFIPIGSTGNACSGVTTKNFTGNLDGANHKINGLQIIRGGACSASDKTPLGIFNSALGATFKNVTVNNTAITAGFQSPIGILAGQLNNSLVQNVQVQGSISSGGGAVSAPAGGITAILANSTISQSAANVNITTGGYIGGLAAQMNSGSIKQSYAKGNITQNMTYYAAGGLVGSVQSANNSISDSYSLVQISFFWTTAPTYTTPQVGGLIGSILLPNTGISITNSFAAGSITAPYMSYTSGGLVGSAVQAPTITSSYWDNQASGQSSSVDSPVSSGLTTAQMYSQASFVGWDFKNTWKILNGIDYPHLDWENYPVTVQISKSVAVGSVDIKGGSIGWVGLDANRNNAIDIYNIPNGSISLLPNTNTDYFGWDIAADKVVYEIFDSSTTGTYSVYMQDLSTGINELIAKNNANYPRISGNNIVYNRPYQGNDAIFLYNINSAQERRITTTGWMAGNEAINDNRIAWMDNTGTLIYTYNLLTHRQSLIGKGITPNINGDYVVYISTRDGHPEVYMYDFITTKEKRITNVNSHKTSPKVAGRWIVWSDDRTGTPEIYGYDMVLNHEYLLVAHTPLFGVVSIDDDRVVWNDNQQQQVYMADLNPNRKYFNLTLTTQGQGKVVSSPVAINCGTQCTAKFEKGQGVTITAQPAKGYRFVKWVGLPVNTSAASTVLTMNKNISVQAVFDSLLPDLTVTGIKETYQYIYPNAQIQIIVTVKNVGLFPTTSTTTVNTQGIYTENGLQQTENFGSGIVPKLQPGQSVTITLPTIFKWNTQGMWPQWQQVTATVDPKDQILEADYSNNSMTINGQPPLN